jgi:hypothetical protein
MFFHGVVEELAERSTTIVIPQGLVLIEHTYKAFLCPFYFYHIFESMPF